MGNSSSRTGTRGRGGGGCLGWGSGVLIGVEGDGVRDTGWQRRCMKHRPPRGKHLGGAGAAQMVAFEVQTKQESMRLFHPYFFYPVL